MELSVVIPSWNTRELLAACLAALERAELPEHEVIVVDNASSDGSAELVAERYPDARLVVNAENEGFARACNQGAALARGRYLLLLNSDTEVAPDAVGRLVAFLDAHEDYGAAAPRLVFPDGRTQRSCKRFPNLATALFFATPLERWWPKSPELARYFMLDWDHEDSRDVEQPPAAALVMRRAVFERLAGFDERLWLFFNDVDLARRMAAEGLRTRYLADAVVLHHEGASTSKFEGFVVTWQRNRLVYYRKHHGWLAGLWVKGCVSLAWLDFALQQLAARVARRPAEPVGPVTRAFLRFLVY